MRSGVAVWDLDYPNAAFFVDPLYLQPVLRGRWDLGETPADLLAEISIVSTAALAGEIDEARCERLGIKLEFRTLPTLEWNDERWDQDRFMIAKSCDHVTWTIQVTENVFTYKVTRIDEDVTETPTPPPIRSFTNQSFSPRQVQEYCTTTWRTFIDLRAAQNFAQTVEDYNVLFRERPPSTGSNLLSMINDVLGRLN